MIVAIDGPAGVGKSTVADCVAKKTGFLNINSGNFYRAITKIILDNNVKYKDKNEITRLARRYSLELKDGRITLDGRDIEEQLHTDKIDKWVSVHSSIPEIRNIVNGKLREAVGTRNAVIEGRDIATVVYPEAEIKIFLIANIETRAKRRYFQGTSKLSLEEIRDSIEKRDTIDRNKEFGGLKKTKGSITIDTSGLTIEQVCEKVVNKILDNVKEQESNKGNESGR
ncbi:MAG: (d)CMP kinase [Spirochaetes bacterium]|nr:MAG: (d)CMP kinase [Spirochaetota bacterium]